ncbi:hypothetical protein YC2023_108268 [Brassica napus]
MARLRSMAGLSPVNFPVTFPANFLADLALLITSQEWLERLMLAGQMNIRRVSGDWIASVCRLCARAPKYRPTILLMILELIRPRLLEGMHLLDKRSRWALPVALMIHDNSTDRMALDPLEGKYGARSCGNSSSNSDFDPIVLAFGIGVMINKDSRCNNPDLRGQVNAKSTTWNHPATKVERCMKMFMKVRSRSFEERSSRSKNGSKS